jgi:hypothetical protein
MLGLVDDVTRTVQNGAGFSSRILDDMTTPQTEYTEVTTQSILKQML